MNDEPALVRHVLIQGRVQGVGYREGTRRMALRLGVSGSVRNRRDGAVDVSCPRSRGRGRSASRRDAQRSAVGRGHESLRIGEHEEGEGRGIGRIPGARDGVAGGTRCRILRRASRKRSVRASRQSPSALRLHVAFPLGSQFADATAVPIIEKFCGEDAIRPEMAKLLTELAPGHQQAHGLGITDDHRPDGSLGRSRHFLGCDSGCGSCAPRIQARASPYRGRRRAGHCSAARRWGLGDEGRRRSGTAAAILAIRSRAASASTGSPRSATHCAPSTAASISSGVEHQRRHVEVARQNIADPASPRIGTLCPIRSATSR